MKNLKFLALLCWAVFFFAGCNKDDKDSSLNCDCNAPVLNTAEVKVQLRTDGQIFDDWYLHDHKYGGLSFYKICNVGTFKTMLISEGIPTEDGVEINCKIELKEPCKGFTTADRSYRVCNVTNVSSNK